MNDLTIHEAGLVENVDSREETISVRGTITRVFPLISKVTKHVYRFDTRDAIGLRSDEGQEIFVFLADLPFDKQWYQDRIGRMIDFTVSVREVEMKIASAPKMKTLPTPQRKLC